MLGIHVVCPPYPSCIIEDVVVWTGKEDVLWFEVCVCQSCAMKVCGKRAVWPWAVCWLPMSRFIHPHSLSPPLSLPLFLPSTLPLARPTLSSSLLDWTNTENCKILTFYSLDELVRNVSNMAKWVRVILVVSLWEGGGVVKRKTRTFIDKGFGTTTDASLARHTLHRKEGSGHAAIDKLSPKITTLVGRYTLSDDSPLSSRVLQPYRIWCHCFQSMMSDAWLSLVPQLRLREWH